MRDCWKNSGALWLNFATLLQCNILAFQTGKTEADERMRQTPAESGLNTLNEQVCLLF